MKRLYTAARLTVGLICVLIMAFAAIQLPAQAPGIQWQNTIGGSGADNPGHIIQTADGGYFLGGTSDSNISGDKTEDSHLSYDYWVLKLDPAGNIVWQNTIGGNGSESFRALAQTSDGGFIIGGSSESNISGDKTENTQAHTADYWVVKLDASGNIEWDNTIGGYGPESISSLQQTSDGGYIIGGWSPSNISGDKTENSRGGNDYWVVKLDASGNIIWQKTIGGSEEDLLLSIQQTTDGGYIVGGNSASNISGEKMENSRGSTDYWILKLNSTGSIIWQKTIGGNDYDNLTAIRQTSDGGYIVGGWSFSDTSGDKTEDSNGSLDYWVARLDAAGNILWQNTIGGNSTDLLFSLYPAVDGGYILGGFTDSGISGDQTEASQGSYDFWILKLNPSGNIVWQKRIGGSGYDNLGSIEQTADGGYILGGFSDSNISGDKTEDSQGNADFWVLKLNSDCPPLNFTLTGTNYCLDAPGPIVGLSGSHADVSYQLQTAGGTNLGGPVTGSSGPIVFGAYPNGAYQVVATASGCTQTITGTVAGTAAPCLIAAPDFCSCNAPDDRAPVTVKISAPAGQTWTVKAVIGLYDAGSPPAPDVPTPMPVGTPLTDVGGNMYTLDGIRLTTKGFWVQVTNGSTDFDVMVGNAAW